MAVNSYFISYREKTKKQTRNSSHEFALLAPALQFPRFLFTCSQISGARVGTASWAPGWPRGGTLVDKSAAIRPHLLSCSKTREKTSGVEKMLKPGTVLESRRGVLGGPRACRTRGTDRRRVPGSQRPCTGKAGKEREQQTRRHRASRRPGQLGLRLRGEGGLHGRGTEGNSGKPGTSSPAGPCGLRAQGASSGSEAVRELLE